MNKNNTDKTKVIRVFEAFSGMGAQRKALTNINANYEIKGIAEWFIPAIISYMSIHTKFSTTNTISEEKMRKYLESKPLSMNSKNPVKPGYWNRKKGEELNLIYSAVKQSEEEGNIFDVTLLHKRSLSDIDLLTYSFPCQDLSQQGKQAGMSKKSGTRSGLLWEIEKALDNTPRENLPKYLLMENVMALMFKTNAKELSSWKTKLSKLGYKNSIKVLNAAEFGSAQARRRAFMLSTLEDEVELPTGYKKPKAIDSILAKITHPKDFLPKLDKYKQEAWKKTKSNINKTRLIGYTTFNSEAYVYDKKFTGPTLTATGANSRIKIVESGKIRKINSEEAYRYMGFTTTDYKKVDKHKYLTEAKKIFTCGNSISVGVLMAIFKEIINDWK